MRPFARSLSLAALAAVLAPAALSAAAPRTALAQDEGAERPAAAPSDLIEQTDRKKMLSIKLPRSWKSASGDQADPNALICFRGNYAEGEHAPNGFVALYVDHTFARAGLARAALLPIVGEVKTGSLRQGQGWAEGCAVRKDGVVEWRRYAEKNGRAYLVLVAAAAAAHDMIKPLVERILDSFTVLADATPPSPGEEFEKNRKTMNGFEVLTDADPDRKQSLDKATSLLAASRKVLAGTLPGKPFDASGPAAWLYQNGSKYEDRAKSVFGSAPEHGDFAAKDRTVLVKLMGENSQGFDENMWNAGARQYVWQYFGGSPPIWLEDGLCGYARFTLVAGGKAGKVSPQMLGQAKSAVAAGKRRLDQWFDVANRSEFSDNNQAALELYAWQMYLRHGKGAKKYKKNLETYISTLRDSGDPAVARKAFDGVNFDEMLQDFKGWATDWK